MYRVQGQRGSWEEISQRLKSRNRRHSTGGAVLSNSRNNYKSYNDYDNKSNFGARYAELNSQQRNRERFFSNSRLGRGGKNY